MAATYKQLTWRDVRVDDVIPRISLLMGFSRVLLSAISTLDYFPGHHDVDYAKAQGQKTIYVNTMTYQGFIDRAVTDWAGPATFITRRAFSMARPIYAGEEMYAEGKVTRCFADDAARHLAEIKIAIGNQTGVCCLAEVTILLPDDGPTS